MNYNVARSRFFLKPLLEFMIMKGSSREDIAQELVISINTANEWSKKIFGMTFNNTRNLLYYMPQIEELIKKGLNISEISIKIQKDSSTINDWIRKYWEFKSFEEARKFKILN